MEQSELYINSWVLYIKQNQSTACPTGNRSIYKERKKERKKKGGEHDLFANWFDKIWILISAFTLKFVFLLSNVELLEDIDVPWQTETAARGVSFLHIWKLWMDLLRWCIGVFGGVSMGVTKQKKSAHA